MVCHFSMPLRFNTCNPSDHVCSPENRR
jgi:hypothetical protein